MPGILVIGYGNPLRGDDGLGPKLANAIDQRQLPEVRVLTPHQLTPDLAEAISQADAVVFIDATVRTGQVEVSPLVPDASIPSSGHTSNPATLLALADCLFGSSPPAWLLTLPAAELGFRETLSAAGEQSLHAGLAAFQQLRDLVMRNSTGQGIRELATRST